MVADDEGDCPSVGAATTRPHWRSLRDPVGRTTSTARLLPSFKAIALWKLERRDEAKQQLERVTDRMAAVMPRPGKADLVAADNWMVCQVALREAQGPSGSTLPGRSLDPVRRWPRPSLSVLFFRPYALSSITGRYSGISLVQGAVRRSADLPPARRPCPGSEGREVIPDFCGRPSAKDALPSQERRRTPGSVQVARLTSYAGAQ